MGYLRSCVFAIDVR
jgi:hypothetical protein